MKSRCLEGMGGRLYVGVSVVERMQNLIEDVYRQLKPDNPKLRKSMIRFVDGERVLEGGMAGSRIIVTDDTSLMLIMTRPESWWVGEKFYPLLSNIYL